MLKNRYFKNTLGIKAEVIIARALDTSGESSAPQATYALFVANAPAGALSVFFDDTNAVVAAGDTADAANRNRKIFFAWKQGDGVAMRTTAIPLLEYKTVQSPYKAGQPDIVTVAYGGTISVGQLLKVRIIDTTNGAVLPHPFYDYETPIVTDVTTALAIIVSKINAETQEPIATASKSSTTLTITGQSSRTIKVVASIDTTVAQPTDASAIVVTYTQKAVLPLGTLADIQELEQYFLIHNGAINYPGGNYNVAEFQAHATNAITGINYGQLTVTARKEEWGAVKNFHDKAYVIIALPTGSLATLAAK